MQKGSKAAGLASEPGFQTLKSRVYLALRDEILSGTTPPGTRLVRRALSERLGVSPIPVIEALHQLEQDGLVESEPMFGHRVRELNVEAVRNDHILREAIECQSARLCAQNATAEQFQALERQAEELDQALKADPEGAAYSEKHLAFHLDVARTTGYQALVDVLEKLWFRRLMVINTASTTVLGVPRNWHGLLVKALASRDPELAEKTMREHVQYNVAQRLKLLEANEMAKSAHPRSTPAPRSGKRHESPSRRRPPAAGRRK